MFRPSDDFNPGPEGTILFLGCYSECWDEVNKPETIKLLAALTAYGNHIQMAIKQVISKDEL